MKKLTRAQQKAVCYEAERAYLLLCGRGGMPEWRSLPESIRVLQNDVHPAPFDGIFGDAEQNEMRRLIYGVLQLALEPHVE